MTGGVLVLGLLLVACLLALVVLIYSRDRQRFLRREQWQSLAHRLGGRVEPGRSRIDFEVCGRRAAVQCDRPADDPRIATSVRVDVRGLSTGALRLFPDEFSRLYKVFARMADLEIGDRDFDRDFVVQATPAEVAHRLFSPDRRAWLIQRIRRVALLGPIRIHLSLDQLEILVWTELHGDDLLALTRGAAAWILILQELAPPAGITLSALGAVCRVCGTGLGDRIVECSRCRTPHHVECWQYAQRCSTFGCGEVRSREFTGAR